MLCLAVCIWLSWNPAAIRWGSSDYSAEKRGHVERPWGMTCHIEREATWRRMVSPRPRTYERSLPSGKMRPPAECRHTNEICPTTWRAEELLIQPKEWWEMINNCCFKSLGLGLFCYVSITDAEMGTWKWGAATTKNLTCVLLAMGSGRWGPRGGQDATMEAGRAMK